MIKESKIFDLSNTGYNVNTILGGNIMVKFDHDFICLREKITETINYLRAYLSVHNLEDITHIRITHTHEIYSKTYFNLIPDNNINELYNLLDELELDGIIFKDNNVNVNNKFTDKILHQSHPYFLGMTTPFRFKINKRNFIKKFCCLNLLPRPNKLDIVKFLYETGINENCHLTHNFQVFDNPSKIIDLDLHKDSLLVSAFSQSSYLPMLLNHNSFCNIVTETSYHDKDVIFITEKTEKCFSAGQPFIIVSTPYFLKELKKRGYKTFSDFWDESYDLVEDNNIRLDMIKEVIKKLNLLSLKELEEMYVKMLPILRHNQRINKEWYYKNLKL